MSTSPLLFCEIILVNGVVGVFWFLDDYITGDQYFRCSYPKHNLVRTRCQLKLAEDIERKWEELEWIVSDVLETM